MRRFLHRHLPACNGRFALLLLALCAFGVQQWVAQTHWHGPGALHAAQQLPPDDDSGQHRDHDCLLCQVAAHAGAAVPPAAVLLALLPAPASGNPIIGVTADFPAPPGHAWHSRGPPEA